jgi:hypothetical protein
MPRPLSNCSGWILRCSNLAHGVVEAHFQDLDKEADGIAGEVAFWPAPITVFDDESFAAFWEQRPKWSSRAARICSRVRHRGTGARHVCKKRPKGFGERIDIFGEEKLAVAANAGSIVEEGDETRLSRSACVLNIRSNQGVRLPHFIGVGFGEGQAEFGGRLRIGQGCIKLKLDSIGERGGDSLSPQSLTLFAGDKLSPPRLSELDAALPIWPCWPFSESETASFLKLASIAVYSLARHDDDERSCPC